MTARSGSVFTGSGMLDVAVCAALDAEPAWFVENDPAAAKVLAWHWPGIPNHGDVTSIDWAAVEPVDVLIGGFPCTDVSSAGKRAGLRPGTRSGLWSHMAYAISQLQPRLVVIENVRGLLSADAYCDLEPDPWGLGDRGDRPLRAIGAVLGDLAQLGYDARWCGLRAADVGAPHGRFRVFIAAWPASDTDGLRPIRGRGTRGRRTGPADLGELAPDPDRIGLEGHERGPGSPDGRRRLTDPGGSAAADPKGVGRPKGWPESAGQLRRPDVALRRDESPTHPTSTRRGPQQPIHVGEHSIETVQAGQTEPRRCGSSAPDPDSAGSETWGIYEPAIRRWERILGRPAPAPTQIGKRGGRQLSPAFCEWMMGWQHGWVTDVPGLSRSDQLKICGNGVVPQQAASGLAALLGSLVGVS